MDSYSCRHGLGYTILTGEKNGIRAQQELFVPRGDACEIDRLTLENKTGAPRTLDVFSYVEFCLWDAMDDSSNFQRNFSTGEVEVVGSAIYHKTEYRERRDHYAVFWANTPVTSFDTSRDAFCGVYGGPAEPEASRQALLQQRGPRLGPRRRPPLPPHAGSWGDEDHPLRAGLHREPGGRKVHRPRRHQ
mgnify:CR=1 FL=1